MRLCPVYTQIGDEVRIFYSGKVPFVIRPLSGDNIVFYYFIGDFYMHGVMYREVLENERGDRWKPQDIVIR